MVKRSFVKADDYSNLSQEPYKEYLEVIKLKYFGPYEIRN